MNHVNITVTGKVQGVSYRASAREKALALGLTGFVSNKKDGSVYLEVEGVQGNINKMIQWCHKGPPFAHVENVAANEGIIRGFKEFQILR